MDAEWDRIIANWATDHRMTATYAIREYSGTMPWAKAREAHRAGAAERVVREWLDVMVR